MKITNICTEKSQRVLVNYNDGCYNPPKGKGQKDIVTINNI